MVGCTDCSPADACPISEKPNWHSGFNWHERFVYNERCYTRKANDEGNEDPGRRPGELYTSPCQPQEYGGRRGDYDYISAEWVINLGP